MTVDDAVSNTQPATERSFWIAFHFVPYIGPATVRQLQRHFGSLERAWFADSHKLRAALNERARNALIMRRRELDPVKVEARLHEQGVRTVTLVDDDYPFLLNEVAVPPPVLFYRGEFLEQDRHAIAIVGTRKVSPYGREVAYTLGRDLAQAGLTIVSGLARGVDGIAHRAAVEAGGRTIAVLGGGVNRIYPHENKQLAERITTQGAVVSEYAPDQGADGSHFPARNRIISGLSLGVIVVEAPNRSGALITVDFAADQGRDVFAVPGGVLAHNSEGCNRILRDGARLVRSAEDVLDDLNLSRRDENQAVQQALPASEDDRRLLAVLGKEPRHIDDIAALASLSVSDASAQLLTLELQGHVRNAGAQHYTLAR